MDKKSELPEICQNLDSSNPEIRKKGAERVIYLMRSGENMRQLFSYMLRCVNTDDLSLKKIVYLYLINYSSQEPEQTIMAVNTFVQDSQNPNPIIRALAVRTMCRIRIQSVAENMVLPLKQTLSDPSPYVRKTAALGVSKLYDIIPEIVENSGLFQSLISLLKDENPLVITNAITSILEINSLRTNPILQLTSETVIPILSALNDCTEWCQITLLDALSQYIPETSNHAESLNDRLIFFLKNENPAVVIGVFKCIYRFLEYDSRGPNYILTKVIPPVMTLLNTTDPEIQYIVLRTLSLFVVKYPNSLSNQISVFFCKYNDKSYIKMEKLNIIMAICTKSKAKLVLDELSQYCNSVDVSFVKRSIHCIGELALKFKGTSPSCVDVLMKLLECKADYAIEEAMIAMCDILRKYPGEFENVIPQVCNNMDQVKEPLARASAIWILGEYNEYIENIDVLIDPFLDTFQDEESIVQSQIITALVKIFINNPENSRDQLQFVLNEAAKSTISPDVQNQALIYWRLLTNDVKFAKDIIIFPKDNIQNVITVGGTQYDESVLEELLRNMGLASGVLRELPSTFIIKSNSQKEKNITKEKKWYQMKINDDIDFIDIFMAIDKQKFYLKISNRCTLPISDFAFAINLNIIGLQIDNDNGNFPSNLDEDENCIISFDYSFDLSQSDNKNKKYLETALRTNYGTVFAYGRIPIEISLNDSGKISQNKFTEYYNTFKVSFKFTINNALIPDDEILNDRKVFVIGKNHNKIFVCCYISDDLIFVGELFQNVNNIEVFGFTNNNELHYLIEENGYYLFAE
ncbi:Adaptin N terminal region family protein [Histomonas meleagridis]|uniref:Adaptin N terminal region family protein n=1 Tax=Histomonas meleagridis TaxID=135588 RepID=UPI0035597F9E|nr:Adaptin N terminal region family protein [Histomonas meleagridis]KAH0806893.1 Adaptin N terminal region family protein [Histomonas meleagridis]